ncbi:MAG: hypothetical protein ACXWDL_08050 [Nocardioides sp.]
MVTLRIEHPVSDFDTWRTAFAGFADVRRQAGVRAHVVRRPVDDELQVSIDLRFAEVGQAVAFEHFLRSNVWADPASSPALRGTPVTTILRDEDVEP